MVLSPNNAMSISMRYVSISWRYAAISLRYDWNSWLSPGDNVELKLLHCFTATIQHSGWRKIVAVKTSKNRIMLIINNLRIWGSIVAVQQCNKSMSTTSGKDIPFEHVVGLIWKTGGWREVLSPHLPCLNPFVHRCFRAVIGVCEVCSRMNCFWW